MTTTSARVFICRATLQELGGEHAQARYPLEVARVPGRDAEIVGQGGCADPGVVQADHCPARDQLDPKLRVSTSDGPRNRNRVEPVENLLGDRTSSLLPAGRCSKRSLQEL